jgi:hypothetical protein
LAFDSATFNVTVAAQLFHNAGDQAVSLELYNPPGNPIVYVGPATVTVAGATKGRPVEAGDSISLDLSGSDDDVYVIGDGVCVVHKTTVS